MSKVSKVGVCHGQPHITHKCQSIAKGRHNKGVCHFKRRKKKRKVWNTPSPNLTLTVTLSPNHYTTSNSGRPCTQSHLVYTITHEYTYFGHLWILWTFMDCPWQHWTSMPFPWLTAGLRGCAYYWQRLATVTVSLVWSYPAVVDVSGLSKEINAALE